MTSIAGNPGGFGGVVDVCERVIESVHTSKGFMCVFLPLGRAEGGSGDAHESKSWDGAACGSAGGSGWLAIEHWQPF